MESGLAAFLPRTTSHLVELGKTGSIEARVRCRNCPFLQSEGREPEYFLPNSREAPMQALHWDGQRLRLRRSYPTPQVTESAALVHVRLAGICSTDLQIFKGYMGFH